MVRRTARRGPNAGNHFWGCSQYSKMGCRGTRQYSSESQEDEDSQQAASTGSGGGQASAGGRRERARTPTQLAPAVKSANRSAAPYKRTGTRCKRIEWHDATMRRRVGWRSYYATVGASLRSIPSEHWDVLSNCQVARQDCRTRGGDPNPQQISVAARAVVAAMRKLLARGTAPPLHPEAESILLRKLDFGDRIIRNGWRNSQPGDISPALENPPTLSASDFTLPRGRRCNFDHSLVESPAESDLVAWMENHTAGSVRWLIAQPSLDALVEAAGVDVNAVSASTGEDHAGDRRCDFLFAPPLAAPVVIEVDGCQHQSQRKVDRQRDRSLAGIGISAIRVSTREIKSKAGPGIAALSELLHRLRQPSNGYVNPLVWAPIQVHRLVLGLCEAIIGGFLSGPEWDVAVEDPTGLAVELIGRYLGLLDALDLMWGEGDVAPALARFKCADSVVVWKRMSSTVYERIPNSETPVGSGGGGGVGNAGDAIVILDVHGSPCEEMPATGETPTVVVRSSLLGSSLLLMRDEELVIPQRLEPFASCRTDAPRMLSEELQEAACDSREAAEEPKGPTSDTREAAEELQEAAPDPWKAAGELRRQAVEAVLRAVFAKESLLEGQFEAIMEVLAGRDCAVLLPTGAGKSLIYQLAGLCLPGRTLAIDPLVSLIDDQGCQPRVSRYGPSGGHHSQGQPS